MSTNQHSREDDRRSDLAVMDANEYKQKRRLQRILDARDGVLDKDDLAWEQYVKGEIQFDGRNILIQKSVKKAIYEVYTHLVEQANEKNGDGEAIPDRYWHGNDEPIGTIEREHQPDITINGLKDFLETDYVYEETWTEPAERRHGPDGEQVRRESYTVPEDLSFAAYRLLQEFLSKEQGIKLTTEMVEVDEEADPF